MCNSLGDLSPNMIIKTLSYIDDIEVIINIIQSDKRLYKLFILDNSIIKYALSKISLYNPNHMHNIWMYCVIHNKLPEIELICEICHFNLTKILISIIKHDKLDIMIFIFNSRYENNINNNDVYEIITYLLKYFIEYGSIICLRYLVDNYNINLADGNFGFNRRGYDFTDEFDIHINDLRAPISKCIINNHINMIQFLISVNALEIDFALWLAMSSTNIGIISYLISVGANFLVEDFNIIVSHHIKNQACDMVRYFSSLRELPEIGWCKAIDHNCCEILLIYMQQVGFKPSDDDMRYVYDIICELQNDIANTLSHSDLKPEHIKDLLKNISINKQIATYLTGYGFDVKRISIDIYL
jgi:hypothetical protein